MDSRIENLPSTTFFGHRLTRRQIADIQETVALCPALSRRELGHTVCEHLGWYTAKGATRVRMGLGLLEQLEDLGILTLPAPRAAMRRGPRKAIARTDRTAPQPAITGALATLTPLTLELVRGRGADWDEMVDRYHYLGYTQPFGPYLRYWIRDRDGHALGCLLFAAATTDLPCRDRWIGWSEKARLRHLPYVVNNMRFLVFPWVSVSGLASKVLSMAVRRLANDWAEHHGFRPVLAETFVDEAKFAGTSYKAANWELIGQTSGKGKLKTAKAVYVYALTPDFKSILLNGPTTPPAVKPRHPARPAALASDDPFVRLWANISATMVTVANAHDHVWQKRRRVLNTFIVMLFIFRLVFSSSRPGYTITLIELWDQCRVLGINMPQEIPVTAGAVCGARAKIDETVFKTLHREILAQITIPNADRRWNGHRVFAVDGSKLNLPRPLVKFGYRPPDNAYYPQGLLSCLYWLYARIPVDFDLCSHENERKAALTHLPALSADDVVVYDRGYFSYPMLHHHVERGLHPVFRIKNKANKWFDAFIGSDQTEAVVEISPSREHRKKLGACISYRVRLIKYTFAKTNYVLATTLLDSEKYPIAHLSDLYHGRWSIEELYKISKQLMTVEQFHSKSERGVKQEIFAHFILITLTRVFTNHAEDEINLDANTDKPKMQANFKNSLATVARNIERLLLQNAEAFCQTVTRIVSSVAACRQRRRPNRSYERRSRKPIGKWRPAKPAKIKKTAAIN